MAVVPLWALLGHRPRTKSVAQIIAELDRLYQLGWRGGILFVDVNLIGNKRWLKTELLPALIDWRKDKRGITFQTEASINMADDEELLQLMLKQAIELGVARNEMKVGHLSGSRSRPCPRI